MGMFDDLIPAGPKTGGGGGMFDDLIPKAPGEDVSAGMVLRGVPVLGAYIPQAEAALKAAAQPLSGAGEPGASWSERYAANLPKRQARYAEVEKDQPIASTAAQTLGGTLALAPLGATALGARALGMAGTAGQRLVAGGTSGAAISAADALARGENPVTAAEIGGGIGAVVPVLGAAVGRIGKTARSYLGSPNAEELGTAVDAGYTALRGSGLEIKPQAMQSAINQIRVDQQIHPRSAPIVTDLLEEAATKGIMSPMTGAKAGVKFDDIDALRKQLGGVARNYANPTEQAAARDAMRGLDDYLAKISPADVLSGDAQQVAKLAAETRGNAATEFRLRAIDAIRERAENAASAANSGMNVENAYRRELKNFIRPNNKGISPAKKEGFTPEEINRMRVATRSTSFPNMLRLVGNMLGGGGGIATTGLAGAGYLSGDPRFYAAAGLGLGARRLSNAMMRNRAEMLSRMTAARSPLAGTMNVGGPGGPLLDLAPTQAGLLSLAAQQGTPMSPASPQYAGPQNFEAAVRGDLQQQFPNESPEQIDRRVQAVVGQMTSGQTFLPEVQGGLRINQPNWENFLAAQPGSSRIIDRRR